MEASVILYIDRTMNNRGGRIARELQRRLVAINVKSSVEPADGVEGIIERLSDVSLPAIGVVGRNSCALANIPDIRYLGRVYTKVVVGNHAAAGYFLAYEAYLRQRAWEANEMIIGRANHRAGLL